MGTILGFWGQNFGRVRVSGGRPGLRTSDAEFDFAALAYNSRLRAVSTFLSPDSESTQNVGCTGYFMDLSDFPVQCNGSVSSFRLEVR